EECGGVAGARLTGGPNGGRAPDPRGEVAVRDGPARLDLAQRLPRREQERTTTVLADRHVRDRVQLPVVVRQDRRGDLAELLAGDRRLAPQRRVDLRQQFGDVAGPARG